MVALGILAKAQRDTYCMGKAAQLVAAGIKRRHGTLLKCSRSERPSALAPARE